MTYGWDHPETARRYEEFCERHERYREANRRLVEHAEIAPGMRVLDLAAGTGRTAELAVAAGARVACWEPASAMRAAGMRRLPAAEWAETPPDGEFDRVLCGAAAWQWQPFAASVEFAVERLRRGGAVVFTIPSLYVGIPDEPGGGPDPLLLQLAGRLACGAVPQAAQVEEPLSPEKIEGDLGAAGLEPERWLFRIRIGQDCLRDWYRIPVLTDALLPDLLADERDERIDRVCQELSTASWRWEGWMGWTAWKR